MRAAARARLYARTYYVRARRDNMMRLSVVVMMAGTVAAHSAMTIPQPRNAIDSDEKPWGGKVPHPLPFEPWCPIPSKAAAGKVRPVGVAHRRRAVIPRRNR